MSEHEIQQFFAHGRLVGRRSDQSQRLEQAVRMADSLQLDAIGFVARKDLISAAIFCGMPERAMPAFSCASSDVMNSRSSSTKSRCFGNSSGSLGNLKRSLTFRCSRSWV